MKSNQGIVGHATILVDFDAFLDNPEKHHPDSNSDSAILVQGDNVRLENFRLKKNFVDGSYGVGIFAIPGSRSIKIKNVEIGGYSARYGIHLLEVSDFMITGCYIHDFMVNTASDMILDSPAGIRVTRSENGVIANNLILRIEVGPEGRRSQSPLKPEYGPHQTYQSDSMTIQSCKHVTITGNTLATSGEGIDMLLSNECTITGNVISDIWFQGIKMLGVSSTVVSGNYITNAHQGIGLSGHANFDAPCEYNNISGNTIRYTDEIDSFSSEETKRWEITTKGSGIEVDNDSDFNLFHGNVIVDDTTPPYLNTGIKKNSMPNNEYVNNLILIKHKQKQ